MQIFNSNDISTFYLNSKKYVKNYVVIPVGNSHIAVYNAYDTKLQLLPSTHYSEISVDGTVYGSQVALMNILSPLIFYKNTSGGGGSINQNNVALFNEFYLSGDGEVSVEDAATYINNLTAPLIISEVQTPVIFSFGKVSEGITKKYLYLFLSGKGIYGGGSSTITPSQLRLISVLTITPDDISSDPNNQITDLGVIEDGDFVATANASESEFDFSDDTKSYYLTYTQDDVLYFVLFVGVNAVYAGDTANSFVEEDFVSITNDTVQPTPSLQQVTAVGNQTTYPIIVAGGGYQVTNNNTGEEYRDIDGRKIRVTYPQEGLTAEDVSYQIPAKELDDTFAMLSDLNGITLTANQAASEIYINDAEGNIITTLNVGFLNNEGTTFYYNSSTQMLELRNDEGAVLSSVPVSAFVSNLMQSVNFNGSTPYVLEFKDASGSVVDSVSFSISNIQGLQSALDGKISTSHPANTVTLSGISNWNTAYGWGNHAGLYLPFGADIPSGANLNSYQTTGIYKQPSTAWAASGSNYPSPAAGILEVILVATGIISQKYTVTTGSASDVYIRKFVTSWSAWEKLIDSTDAANYVTTNTNQTGIAGTKEWTGRQDYITNSSRVYVDGSSTGGLRNYYDMKEFISSESNLVGSMHIRLPFTTTTMWSIELTLYEYLSSTPANIYSPTKLRMTGYGVNAVANKSVWCDNPDRFSQVRFGTISGGTGVYLIVDKASGYGNFSYPKVTLDKVTLHYSSSNSTIYADPANYTLNITTDETSFVAGNSITNADFVRDNYYLNASNLNAGTVPYSRLPISSTDVNNWNTAYGWGNHSGLYMPLGGVIPASTDLNTYQTTGIYRQPTNTNAANGSNYPTPYAGELYVHLIATGLVIQRYSVAGGTEDDVYIRKLASAVWTDWEKLLDSNDILSLSSNYLPYTGATNNIHLNTKTISFSNGGAGYFTLSNEKFLYTTTTGSGGWARNFIDVTNSTGSTMQAFGVLGSGQGIHYAFIGSAYNTSNLKVTPDGKVSIGYTTAIPSSYQFDVNGNSRLAGNVAVTGVITASGGTSNNWNTAYGWGNHAGLYAKTQGTGDFSDFNTLYTAGTSFLLTNTSASNSPEVSSGRWVVNQYQANTGGYGYQLAGRASNTTDASKLYYRHGGNGVWSSWYKLWNSGDFTSTDITNWNSSFTNQGNYLPKSGGTMTGAIEFGNQTVNQSAFLGTQTASTAIGYASWMTQNLKYDYTNEKFIKPRGTLSSLALSLGTGNNGLRLLRDTQSSVSHGADASLVEVFAVSNLGNITANGSIISNGSIASGGNITATGSISASGGTSNNWNTAYGWGNHAGLYLPLANLSGSTNEYVTGNGSLQHFPTSVKGTPLTGFSPQINPVNDGDTIQSALEKLAGNQGTKAPTQSPNLTGTPTAPTATNGTNNTQIATTAFVNNTLQNKIVENKVVGDAELIDMTSLLAFTTHLTYSTVGADGHVTLAVPSANTGKVLKIYNISSDDVHIAISDSSFNIWFTSALVNSVTLAAGNFCEIYDNGQYWLYKQL